MHFTPNINANFQRLKIFKSPKFQNQKKIHHFFARERREDIITVTRSSSGTQGQFLFLERLFSFEDKEK